jgi:hypothetical protein
VRFRFERHFRRVVDLRGYAIFARFTLAPSKLRTGLIASHPVVFEHYIRALRPVTLKVLAKVGFSSNTTRELRQLQMRMQNRRDSHFATAIHKAHIVPFVLFLAVAGARRWIFEFLLTNVAHMRCLPCAVGLNSI